MTDPLHEQSFAHAMLVLTTHQLRLRGRRRVLAVCVTLTVFYNIEKGKVSRLLCSYPFALLNPQYVKGRFLYGLRIEIRKRCGAPGRKSGRDEVAILGLPPAHKFAYSVPDATLNS